MQRLGNGVASSNLCVEFLCVGVNQLFAEKIMYSSKAKMIFLKKNGYLKASSAKVASKRLVSRMFPAMRYQIGGLAECFATYHAFVRFFSCNSRDD